jgi:hypothetical protein
MFIANMGGSPLIIETVPGKSIDCVGTSPDVDKTHPYGYLIQPIQNPMPKPISGRDQGLLLFIQLDIGINDF